MNFQPSDYLSNLNLVFDTSDVSPVDEPSHNANLDFFSQADFFDLDVFSSDFAAREKQNMTMPLPPAQLPSQQTGQNMGFKLENSRNVAVKQEDKDSTVAGPSGASSVVGNDFSPFSPASTVGATDSIDSTDSMEVKRRRNTAASARFRVKKKLKEKQMEEHARNLQDRLGQLEKKLRTLEMENKCLRQLIVEKTEKKNCELLDSIKKRSLGSVSSDGHNTATAFTYTN